MVIKKLDDKFIASVPELIEEFRGFKEQALNHPEIAFPWPRYVPAPEVLDREIAYLEKVFDGIEDKTIRTGGELQKARKRVKTRFSQLARYAVLTLEGAYDLERWPGFDLGRNPGEGRGREPYRTARPVGKKII